MSSRVSGSKSPPSTSTSSARPTAFSAAPTAWPVPSCSACSTKTGVGLMSQELDGRAYVVGAVTDHDDDLRRLGGQRRLQHVPQRGLAADRMQHLRVRGLQPLALAGGQDDRGQRAGACGLALGQRAHFPVGAHMVAARGWRGKQRPRATRRPSWGCRHRTRSRSGSSPRGPMQDSCICSRSHERPIPATPEARTAGRRRDRLRRPEGVRRRRWRGGVMVASGPYMYEGAEDVDPSHPADERQPASGFTPWRLGPANRGTRRWSSDRSRSCVTRRGGPKTTAAARPRRPDRTRGRRRGRALRVGGDGRPRSRVRRRPAADPPERDRTTLAPSADPDDHRIGRSSRSRRSTSRRRRSTTSRSGARRVRDGPSRNGGDDRPLLRTSPSTSRRTRRRRRSSRRGRRSRSGRQGGHGGRGRGDGRVALRNGEPLHEPRLRRSEIVMPTP